jgi:hypothetical protein
MKTLVLVLLLILMGGVNFLLAKPPVKEIIMGELEIIGKVEKPQAVYIIPKAKSGLEDVDLRKSFVDSLIEPLDLNR